MNPTSGQGPAARQCENPPAHRLVHVLYLDVTWGYMGGAYIHKYISIERERERERERYVYTYVFICTQEEGGRGFPETLNQVPQGALHGTEASVFDFRAFA